jgi:hypothetical protein
MLEKRELLPTPHVHTVFTPPRELATLALQNTKVVYDLLFRTSAAAPAILEWITEQAVELLNRRVESTTAILHVTC